MRQTGETNLGFVCWNLQTYPPMEKFYGQLTNYPQRMDKVLKGLMLEIADLDQQEAREGMQGAEGDDPTFTTQGTNQNIWPFRSSSLLKRALVEGRCNGINLTSQWSSIPALSVYNTHNPLFRTPVSTARIWNLPVRGRWHQALFIE